MVRARDLIIVRTYKADAASLAAYDRYAGLAGFDVVFCVDERAAPSDMGGRDKVVFDTARLEAMGLYPHPDCGWQCGDYFYHVARLDRPDYEFYWLIEPDVHINVADPGDFFGLFAANKADLLAPRLTYNDHSWSWTKEIAATGLPPWRCFFPVTRLSGRGVDHVFATRQLHARNPAIAAQKAWPNDEGITASALAGVDFLCQDLNDNGIYCYNGASLNGVALIDPDVLAAQAPDGLIYHPVRTFAAWFATALASAQDIERDPVPETNFGKICGRAVHLSRIAQTCLRNPAYVDSSLMPLMLAAHLWAIRPQRDDIPEFTKMFHERAARLNRMRLDDHFGIRQNRREVGRAHVVVERPTAIRQAPVAASDFGVGEPFALARLPRAAALPYAWDLDAGELLFTTHLSVAAVLAEPHLPQGQRDMARVVVRVPTSRLARAHAPREDDPTLRIVLAQEEEGADLLGEALRRASVPAAILPGALMQMAANLPMLGEAIRPGAFHDLIRFSLMPFLHVGCSTVVVAGLPARFVTMLVRVFPDARYLVLRDTPLPPSLELAFSHAALGVTMLSFRRVKEGLLF